ncbi:hypothetical protein Tco_0596453 [Tanacetum coccineum]
MLVMFRFYVKFHGVPMASFSEDELSVIVTKLAMIELRADMGLKDIIVFSWEGAKYGMFTSNHGTLHVASSSYSTTLIAEMIDKFERQMIEGKLLLVDDDGKPLPKSVSTVNVNCDSEVEEVFNEHTGFMTSTTLKSGNERVYGTKSLLEQLRETKRDDD